MPRTNVTCLDCGTEFVRPNGYEGNYCPSCHESWAAGADADEREADDDAPRRLRRRTTPSVRRLDDADADAPSRYEEE